MTRRDRLGRGLGALLGEYLSEEAGAGAEARTLPCADLAPNPFQPRREFREEELADLADSIRQNGLLQPVVVRPARGDAGGPAWELVVGERRWRACMRLGMREIAAVVREVDDRTLLVLAMVENLQRAALSALEEAEGYRQLMDEFGLTAQEIAEAVGRDRSTIANSLRLLQLPDQIRHLVMAGKLSAGHARALLGASGERRMIELAERAASEGWSVRKVEAQVQRARATRPAARPLERRRDPAERRLEEELQRAMGTAARIHRTRGNKGHIEIPFYSAEDFERIYELLVGSPAAEAVS